MACASFAGVRLPTPQPADVRDVHEGRPYELWLPKSEPPWPGMVVLHGAGSCKENHSDFARACMASGWAAITYDQRGHGEAEDEMGPRAVEDVTRMARFLAATDGVDERRVCARGSSMGGFMAIHAGAVSELISGVIAICPAEEPGLRRALRDGELEMRADVAALDAWLSEHDIRDAVAMLAGRPLLLLHARGDERVPYTASEELFARAGEPKRLIVTPGGHHRSIQHDLELQSYSLIWLERRLR